MNPAHEVNYKKAADFLLKCPQAVAETLGDKIVNYQYYSTGYQIIRLYKVLAQYESPSFRLIYFSSFL